MEGHGFERGQALHREQGPLGRAFGQVRCSGRTSADCNGGTSRRSWPDERRGHDSLGSVVQAFPRFRHRQVQSPVADMCKTWVIRSTSFRRHGDPARGCSASLWDRVRRSCIENTLRHTNRYEVRLAEPRWKLHCCLDIGNDTWHSKTPMFTTWALRGSCTWDVLHRRWGNVVNAIDRAGIKSVRLEAGLLQTFAKSPCWHVRQLP